MLLDNSLVLIILFYLLGSLPFALILTKVFGYGDIRNIGSGNVGATNVLRTGNKFLAFIVLCFDILKGLTPFIILNLYFNEIDILFKIFICHFAILGHIFPIWLKFKGGKGVATYIGFLFGLNLYIGFSFLFIWLIMALFSKYSSLSSLIASLMVSIIIFLIETNDYISVFLFYLFLVITLKHLENIKRLINRTENKIKFNK
ncbi:glycerol-3-phosphate 1-O-acyltransferase PlsY [Alphaproteobacteria bacterium]|nr:glycerol-3-phosphate 1-O-acyltransferase PlsY [Alphaproteobacteria bacterium]